MEDSLKNPPTAGRWESLRLLRKYDFNYIEIYTELQKRWGDVFCLYLPRLRYVVSHPNHVRHVLKDNHANYVKSADYKELEPLLGQGLLNSEGELWKRQRRLISGEFTHERAQKLGGMIVAATERLRERWRERASSGETFDAAADIMSLTFEIACQAFFGSEMGVYAKEAGHAFEEAGIASSRRMVTFLKLPVGFPTPNNLRYTRAVKKLDVIIHQLIEQRRKNPTDRPDLLSRLVAAGDALTPKLLRDELMTFMIAGHETTSLAMTWTWYLLSRHPRVHESLREENRRVLGDRSPTVADLPKLPYNRMVLQEVMRLYPPAPAVSRTPLKDDEIGGYRIRAGSLLTVVQSIVHRDPRFWEKPEEFLPERFSDPSKLQPFSYFPFGAGPRICVGEPFAMMEAQLVLATLAPHFNLTLAESAKVIPHPLVTLRPKFGLSAVVQMQ